MGAWIRASKSLSPFGGATDTLLFKNQKDIQSTIAFLTTRVKSPYKDDWMKLKRILKILEELSICL
jgi:hypothetical protein